MYFTGTTYTVDGANRLLSHEEQTLTLTDDTTDVLDNDRHMQVLLKTKILDHSQRWKRTADDNGYFQLKSLDESGIETGSLTLEANGKLTITDGMFNSVLTVVDFQGVADEIQ